MVAKTQPFIKKVLRRCNSTHPPLPLLTRGCFYTAVFSRTGFERTLQLTGERPARLNPGNYFQVSSAACAPPPPPLVQLHLPRLAEYSFVKMHDRTVRNVNTCNIAVWNKNESPTSFFVIILSKFFQFTLVYKIFFLCGFLCENDRFSIFNIR